MSFSDAGSASGCASSALLGGGCEGMGMDFQSFNLRLAYRFFALCTRIFCNFGDMQFAREIYSL
ncbi:hypothetical protein ANAPH2_01260 [Anaplasma phagocytophilum]|nr:hypothetical protein ANAPH2_01260 [Anaplasma phagocytophilum]